MKTQILITSVMVVILSALQAGLAPAATIAPVGSVVDDTGTQITYWKTGSIAKPLDGDGDNVFGTLADIMYAIRYKNGGTLFSFDGSDAQVGPFPGYASVDDPNGEVYPNTSHSLIQVRTTSATPGTGNAHNMFVFTVLTNGTPDFRLGIVSDVLDGAQFSPAATGLRQLAGPSNTFATASLASNANNVGDMNFFDVHGAVQGDQFAVWGVGGSGGFVTHSIVTWDAIPVPEPSSLAMLAFGMISLWLFGGKRRVR